MSSNSVSDLINHDVPLLQRETTLRDALPALIESGLPALPVVAEDESFCGIFGEREVIAAVFPGYVKELDSARFIPRSIEVALEKRAECVRECVGDHMTREHIEVAVGFADVQLAETFLHHDVVVVPITDEGRVVGVITRSQFARSLAERVLKQV